MRERLTREGLAVIDARPTMDRIAYAPVLSYELKLAWSERDAALRERDAALDAKAHAQRAVLSRGRTIETLARWGRMVCEEKVSPEHLAGVARDIREERERVLGPEAP
jgi:hypothetical protein